MMDRELQSTDNATVRMNDTLQELREHLKDREDVPALRLLMRMEALMKGRSLVMSDLNGALAYSIHLGDIGIPEQPTEEHRQQWRELMRVAEHVS